MNRDGAPLTKNLRLKDCLIGAQFSSAPPCMCVVALFIFFCCCVDSSWMTAPSHVLALYLTPPPLSYPPFSRQLASEIIPMPPTPYPILSILVSIYHI